MRQLLTLARVLLPLLQAALLYLLSLNSAWALSGVTVLVSAPSAASSEFIEQFKVELTQLTNARLSISVVTTEALTANPALIMEDNMLVAVGVQALSQASKLDARIQVFGVLVPRPSYNKILTDSKRQSRNLSAIVLDQPFSRQISLFKTILPSATNAGVLLGPASKQDANELLQAANQQNLAILQVNVNDSTDLVPKLTLLLESTPALLAVPDPVVYTRETAQAILLTTYRYQKPVIGFSQAYVKAGALAAVYSTPRQIAKQIAEELALMVNKSRNALPPVLAPKYFSVDVNRQVARSLGIELIDENLISETLSRIERSLP